MRAETHPPNARPGSSQTALTAPTRTAGPADGGPTQQYLLQFSIELPILPTRTKSGSPWATTLELASSRGSLVGLSTGQGGALNFRSVRIGAPHERVSAERKTRRSRRVVTAAAAVATGAARRQQA